MLKWLMKRKLRGFGSAFGYDTTYGAELIDADMAAGRPALATPRTAGAAAGRGCGPRQ